MRRREAALWGLGASASLWATVWSWRGPPLRELPPAPPARPRPPSAAERQALDRQLAQLRADLAAATARLGSPPALEQLEGIGPDGLPVLAHGLPDNVLVPGVAGVSLACPPTGSQASADWWYCPQTGAIGAGEP